MTPAPAAAEPTGSSPSALSGGSSQSVEAPPRRLVTLATTALGAAALLAAGVSGQAALLAVTLVLSLVLAWSWPTISGTVTPQATGGVLALSAFAIVLSALRDDLRWVAAAAAFGILLSFFAQLGRTTGREGLLASLFSAFGGLVLIASGTTAVVVVGDSDRGHAVVAVSMAAVVAAIVADLVVGTVRRSYLLGLVAVLLGIGAAVGVRFGFYPTSTITPVTAIIVGATVGAVSWALRRVLTLQPGMGTLRGQVGAGVGSLLAVGAVIHLATVIT